MNLKQQLKHTWKWIIMPFSGSSDTVLLFFLSEKSQKDWIKESKIIILIVNTDFYIKDSISAFISE